MWAIVILEFITKEFQLAIQFDTRMMISTVRKFFWKFAYQKFILGDKLAYPNNGLSPFMLVRTSAEEHPDYYEGFLQYFVDVELKKVRELFERNYVPPRPREVIF